VISRFVKRSFLFDEPGARDSYLRRVPAALKRSDWRALAYALMSSHVHWVMKAGDRPSSTFVQSLHSGFANWLNRCTGGLGQVFADRHRTIVCDGETAAALIAYVHNNPVRAGLVGDPADSAWTSHRAYVGLEPAPPWLDVELGLLVCGFEPTTNGRLRFDDFVRSRLSEPRSIVLSGGDLERRRAVARVAACNPVELAAPKVHRIGAESVVQTPVVVPPQCPLRSTWTGSPLAVVTTVARGLGLSDDVVRSRTRIRAVTAARRLALLVWCGELSRPNLEMARALGISASSACGLCARASADERLLAARLALELRALSP
jgi:hypothetical protein